ncbi:MAG: bifunctional metallophosphatase/5'-nucleotidase [Clostridium sp.]
MELTILHTNDIHSNFENFAKIVTKINELRNENTLILDAGDFADFKRMELLGTNGYAAVDLLKCGGYDAIAIGNNETFNGTGSLRNMASNGSIPFLTCNIEEINDGDFKGVLKSVIINKNNVNILIIGTSPSLGPFNEMLGFKSLDMIKSVKYEVDNHHGEYDVCILLSHLGMDSDKILAHEIPQIDVIVGGHYHILMEKAEKVGSCIVHTSGQYGEHLGVLKVSLEDDGVSLISSENINISNEKMDEGVLKILKQNKEKALDKLMIPLYKIDRDLWHDVISENPITNALADALLELYNCDFGIINSGVLNSGIPKGEVNKLRLLQIAPSPLNPCVFEIEGRYIREALNLALDVDLKLSEGRGPGFRGRFVGNLHVSSNVQIHYDSKQVVNILINGEELLEDKIYSIATSDYLHRGSGYSPLKNNKNVEYNIMYIRDLLECYLCKIGVVEKAFSNRWRAI